MPADSILLIRHGEKEPPDMSSERPFDQPLTPRGRQQAQQLADTLAGVQLDRIFCSPYLRTVHTALPIADRRALPLCIDPGLVEQRLDKDEKFLPAEALVQQGYAIDPSYEPVRSDFVPPPIGETQLEVASRGKDVVAKICQTASGTIAIVAHLPVLSAAFDRLCGPHARNEENIGFCSMSRLVASPGTASAYPYQAQLVWEESFLH